jgi:phosphoribosylformimino-5-aminoimidazole carboxamide ribotide isomerase
MRIIPAIDIIGGKCVRLTRGDYSTSKIYNENPLEVAKEFEDHGIKYLHLVDLDGARSKKIINHKILGEIAARTKLIIDFGGGIKTADDVKTAFSEGASQVTGGSVAVKDPDAFLSWLNSYGSDKIILGADYNKCKISIAGWTEDSGLDLFDFVDDYFNKGVRYTICTDISKDGMLQGISVKDYIKILERTKINLIASGGVSSISDIAAVKDAGCEGVIIGKAIYEGRIDLKELAKLC